MQCAKCKAEMRPIDVEGIVVDRCGTCGGLWFDLRELDRLLKQRGIEVDTLDTGHPLKGERQNEQRDIDCPKCHTPMVKLSHHEQRQVEYERCATCGGVYLDAGEFDDLREHTLGEKLRQVFPRLFGGKKDGDESAGV